MYVNLARQACLGAGNVNVGEVVFGGPLAVRSCEIFLRIPQALLFKKAKTHTKNPHSCNYCTVQILALKD